MEIYTYGTTAGVVTYGIQPSTGELTSAWPGNRHSAMSEAARGGGEAKQGSPTRELTGAISALIHSKRRMALQADTIMGASGVTGH